MSTATLTDQLSGGDAMEVRYDCCCGIDVHKKKLGMCYAVLGTGSRRSTKYGPSER